MGRAVDSMTCAGVGRSRRTGVSDAGATSDDAGVDEAVHPLNTRNVSKRVSVCDCREFKATSMVTHTKSHELPQTRYKLTLCALTAESSSLRMLDRSQERPC
jgi:hypothetical protein